MKAKIFSFIGLVVASVGASIIFAAAPAHAAGEEYIWRDQDTIVGRGGVLDQFVPELDPSRRGTPLFTRESGSNSLIYQVTGFVQPNACRVTLTITYFSNDPSKATISADNCHDSPTIQSLFADLPSTRQIDLQDADRGPPPVDNITEDTECDPNDDRCIAVQACVRSGQSQESCLQDWLQCRGGNDADECREQMIDASSNVTTCAIDGVGWILCPIANFLADIADAAYGIVASLLAVQPLLTTGTSEPVYQAWSVMRNIANVAFVIAFLVIIFSQITSIGISNYGIKRMLPRLIVAAILVNISYWICAIAVDISNILGSSIKGLFDNIGATLESPDFSSGIGGQTEAGAGWGALTGIILAGTAVAATFYYVTFAALFPILITVVTAIVAVFIVLALRQALIILLVVISPLAFVAYLLPNTEGWFSKWRDFFQTLLLMYPIIGLLFGASALASQIVTNSAANVDQPQRIVVQIMGAGIAVIPLIITPVFFKALSGVLERFGLNNPSKGLVDRARNAASGLARDKQATKSARRGSRNLQRVGSIRENALRRAQAIKEGSGKVLGKEGSRRRRAAAAIVGGAGQARAGAAELTAGAAARRKAELEASQRELGRSSSEYITDKAKNDEAFRRQLARGGGEGAETRALAGAISAQSKMEAEEVSAASTVLKDLNLDRDEATLRTLANGGVVKAPNGANLNGTDYAVRAAAAKYMVDSHDVKGVNSLLDKVSADPNFMDQKMRESFADSLATSSEKPVYMSQSAISNLRRHGERDENGQIIQSKNSRELRKDAIEAGAYSTEKIATGDRDELFSVQEVAKDSDVDNSRFKANAEQALEDPRYSTRISKNLPAVEAIANSPAPASAAPSEPAAPEPVDRDDKYRYL